MSNIHRLGRQGTPANMLWEEINSETLAVHKDAREGGRHTLLCVINHMSGEATKIRPDEEFSGI